MMAIVGSLIVTFSVVGGYLLEGGKIEVLFQPIELLIIGGAAVGSLIVSASPSLMKQIVQQILGVLKGHAPTKAEYLELIGLLFELCKTAKANPLAIEGHVENPENSEIFKKYPSVMKNHHALHFLCDTLKVQLSGSMSPYDLEDLMNCDLNTTHAEELKGPEVVSKMGDAMPGLGIVAAVLGVVITMGKLAGGKEVIGHSVAAALIGTFLGILFSYGYIQPLSSRITANIGIEGRYMDVIKQSLLALAKNCGPKVCVEFGRRAIPPDVRPTFAEVDAATTAGGAKAA